MKIGIFYSAPCKEFRLLLSLQNQICILVSLFLCCLNEFLLFFPFFFFCSSSKKKNILITRGKFCQFCEHYIYYIGLITVCTTNELQDWTKFQCRFTTVMGCRLKLAHFLFIPHFWKSKGISQLTLSPKKHHKGCLSQV